LVADNEPEPDQESTISNTWPRCHLRNPGPWQSFSAGDCSKHSDPELSKASRGWAGKSVRRVFSMFLRALRSSVVLRKLVLGELPPPMPLLKFRGSEMRDQAQSIQTSYAGSAPACIALRRAGADFPVRAIARPRAAKPRNLQRNTGELIPPSQRSLFNAELIFALV